MFCPKCGRELEETAKFCRKCGTPRPKELTSSTHTVEPTPTITADDSSCYGREKTTGKENSRSTSMANEANAGNDLRGKYSRWIVPLSICIVLFAVISWFIISWMQSPSRVKETGAYVLGLYESTGLSSIDTTVEFERVEVCPPDYDTLTTEIDFFIKVSVPNPKKFKPYLTWLKDFEVNGISTPYETGTEMGIGSLYLPNNSAEKIYQTDEIIYKISYPAKSAEDHYTLLCRVNSNLSFEFNLDCSFWDLPGVNKEDAIAYNQGKLDGTEIPAVDWNNDGPQLDYEEGKLYRLYGTVLSCGKYMGDWSDKYYITIDAANAFPGYDVHCYFDKANWESISPVQSGDTVAFYGIYDYEFCGWDFRDCYVYSPSGKTFVINDDGTSEIVETGSNSVGVSTSDTPGTDSSYTDTPGGSETIASDISNDFSLIEGSYHMVDNYSTQMDLWFEYDVSGLNADNWQTAASEPLELHFMIMDYSGILGDGVADWWPTNDEYPCFKGELYSSADPITIEYDGYNFAVTCPVLGLTDASFFAD